DDRRLGKRARIGVLRVLQRRPARWRCFFNRETAPAPDGDNSLTQPRACEGDEHGMMARWLAVGLAIGELSLQRRACAARPPAWPSPFSAPCGQRSPRRRVFLR